MRNAPKHVRDGRTYAIHGYQVWVALPKDAEEMNPRFDFVAKEDWNEFTTDKFEFKIIAELDYKEEETLNYRKEVKVLEEMVWEVSQFVKTSKVSLTEIL